MPVAIPLAYSGYAIKLCSYFAGNTVARVNEEKQFAEPNIILCERISHVKGDPPIIGVMSL